MARCPIIAARRRSLRNLFIARDGCHSLERTQTDRSAARANANDAGVHAIGARKSPATLLIFAVDSSTMRSHIDGHLQEVLMEPVAAKSPRSGIRGTLGFLTTRIGATSSKGRPSPSLAEMEAELKGLQQRLRARRLGLVSAVGNTLQLLPMVLPVVARVSASMLRRDSSRSQPPAS